MAAVMVLPIRILAAAYWMVQTSGAVAAPGFQPTERIYAEVLAQHARKDLDQVLRDLPTARFQNVYAVTLKLKDPNFGVLYDGFAICGEVNDVKTGWRPFAVAIDNGSEGPRSVYLEGYADGSFMLDSLCRDRQNPTVRIDENPIYGDLVTGKKQVVHD